MVAPWLVAALISLAISVISYVLMPQPKAPKPESVKDLETPTAEAGREIPVVFGTMTIKSPNCLWFGEKRKATYEVKA
jgi:hypothetical protein